METSLVSKITTLGHWKYQRVLSWGWNAWGFDLKKKKPGGFFLKFWACVLEK